MNKGDLLAFDRLKYFKKTLAHFGGFDNLFVPSRKSR
jgi:hypothetical protein